MQLADTALFTFRIEIRSNIRVADLGARSNRIHSSLNL